MNKKIIDKIKEFRDKRNWKQFHTGEHLAKALIIEAAELLECFQWEHEAEDIEPLKEELADVFMYAILLADHYDFDIEEIILNKLEKNKKKYPVNKAYGKNDKYDKL